MGLRDKFSDGDIVKIKTNNSLYNTIGLVVKTERLIGKPSMYHVEMWIAKAGILVWGVFFEGELELVEAAPKLSIKELCE